MGCREDTYTASDCQAVQSLLNFVAKTTSHREITTTVTSSEVDRITGALVPLLRQLVLLQAVQSNTVVSTLTDNYHDLAASLNLPSLCSLIGLMTEGSAGPGNLWHGVTSTWLVASRERAWLHDSSDQLVFANAFTGLGMSPTDLVFPKLNTDFIPLPTEYNELFSMVKASVCPTLKTQTKYPALCLLCGTVCCFQAPCCATRAQVEDNPPIPVGGTWLHAHS